MRFKTFLLETTTIQAPSPNNVDDVCQVGNVIFDQKHGLGQVPLNQSVSYFGFVAMMTPEKFLSIAASGGKEREEAGAKMKSAIEAGKGIGSPFLDLDIRSIEDEEQKQFAKVIGHEGRARCNMLIHLGLGKTEIPVHMFPKGGVRARNLSEEIIQKIHDNLLHEKSDVKIQNPFSTYFLSGKTYVVS